MRLSRKLLLCGVIGGIIAGCAPHGTEGLIPQTVPAASNLTRSFPDRVAPVGNSMEPTLAGARGSVQIAVSARPDEFVDLQALYPRLKHRPVASAVRRPHVTFTKYEFDATLYPGAASALTISHKMTVAAKSANPNVSASVTFTNVPLGNNEWVIVYLYGDGADGSQVFLGNLAGMVDAASASPKIVVTPASTLVFQCEMSMLESGLMTAADLESPTVATRVAAAAKAFKIVASPETGEYSSATLLAFVKAWAPSWQRYLLITPNANAQYVTVANDATNQAEDILQYNENQFYGGLTYGIDRPYGAPCETDLYTQNPGKHFMVSHSCYGQWTIDTYDNAPKVPVYGNALIVGQVNYNFPIMTGSNQKLSNLPAGKSRSVTLGTLTNGQITVKTYAPFNWVEKTGASIVRNSVPGTIVPSGQYGDETGGGYGFYFWPSANWGVSSPGLYAMSWNPWDLPASAFEICSWRNACVGLSSGKTLTINPPFYDPGSGMHYFGWAANQGSGVAVEPQNACSANSGYQWTSSSEHFSMSMTGTRPEPVWMAAYQQLKFDFLSNGGCSGVTAGTQIIVTAKDTNGIVYTNSGVAECNNCPATVTMNSVTQDTTMQAITIMANIPNTAPQTLDIQQIEYPNSGGGFYGVRAPGKR